MRCVALFLCLVGHLCCNKSPTGPSASETVLFEDSFASYPDGLISNEFAFWNPGSPGARHSDKWELTSGSLFSESGAGWTGVPDSIGPNALSTNGNNSAIFRLTSKRSDFRSVVVSFELINQGLTETRLTPRTDLDGVHVFLHYQNEAHLYYASVNRRDNTMIIKKKTPPGPSNGGTYYDLSNYLPFSVPYNTWQRVSATINTNSDGSVTIELSVGGRVVSTIDTGSVGGQPITSPGKVGIRGDNANFKFRNFKVKTP